jgi:hypothetical protein
MLNDLSFLQPLNIFPPESESPRLKMYEENENLYQGDHHLVWRDLWDLQDLQDVDTFMSDFFKTPYGQRKLEFNWFLTVCNVFSDFLVCEPPRLLGTNLKEQAEVDALRLRSNLDVTLYRAATNTIKFNHAILKARFKGKEYQEPGSVIENIKPSIWFGITNPDNEDEYISHVIAWTLTAPVGSSSAKLLKVEIHSAGKIQHQLFWMNGNQIDHEVPLATVPRFASLLPTQETGVPYPLIFVIKNTTDDFKNMKNLVKELCMRIIKVASILDIHSRPLMAGPDNMLTTDMETGEERLNLNGRYFPIRDPLLKPTYIEWDGKLDSSFKEMDRITSMLYKVTDLNPAALGDYSEGMQVSGSAWRRLLVRTIAKTSRLRMIFDVPIKQAIRAASLLDVKGNIPNSVELNLKTIGWQDGLPRDAREDTDVEQARKNSGLTSKRSSIMRLDNCTEAEADAEIARMQTEIPDAPREQSPQEGRTRNPGDKQPRSDDGSALRTEPGAN